MTTTFALCSNAIERISTSSVLGLLAEVFRSIDEKDNDIPILKLPHLFVFLKKNPPGQAGLYNVRTIIQSLRNTRLSEGSLQHSSHIQNQNKLLVCALQTPDNDLRHPLNSDNYSQPGINPIRPV